MKHRAVLIMGIGSLIGGFLHTAGCATSSDEGTPIGISPDGSVPLESHDAQADEHTPVPDAALRCETDAAVCVPFTTRTTPCGICGTKTEVCQTDCEYAAGACSNELAGGCRPGFIKTTTDGCTGGEVKSQICNSECAFEPPGPCGPPGSLTISAVVGGTVSAEFALSPLSDRIKTILGHPYYECPTKIQERLTSYSWVRLVNPTNSTAVVSAWEARPDGATTDVNTLAAWYSRTTIPTTDKEREACSNQSNDECLSPPCAGNEYPGFVLHSKNDDRITIPPNSHVMIYTGAYHTDETGSYVLYARTDSL